MPVYIVLTMIGRHITDLEILDEEPKFPPTNDSLEEKRGHIRVFHGNVNGGDSEEMHFNYETYRWET